MTFRYNVTAWDNYHYKIELPKPLEQCSKQEVAEAISLKVARKERQDEFTGHARTFNYFMKALERTNLNFRVNSPIKNFEDDLKNRFAYAHSENLKEKPKKIKCPSCNGKGCTECNQHGELISYNPHRVGITQSKHLIIEIDNHDLTNLKDVVSFYSQVLDQSFRIWKTNKGFWCVATKPYNSIDSFRYAHCRVLCPSLELKDYEAYKTSLLALKGTGIDGDLEVDTDKAVRTSKLFKGHGDFDVCFTFLSIRKGKTTLRYSKKHQKDEIREIFI